MNTHQPHFATLLHTFTPGGFLHFLDWLLGLLQTRSVQSILPVITPLATASFPGNVPTSFVYVKAQKVKSISHSEIFFQNGAQIIQFKEFWSETSP